MERVEPERLPWAIPDLVEEKEAFQDNLMETQLYTCRHPEDRTWMYGDLTKHLFGAKHLTREEVLTNYADYVLRPLGAQAATQENVADLRRKRMIVITAFVVLIAVIVAVILRLTNLL